MSDVRADIINGVFDVMAYIESRTPFQAYLDGAFSAAKHDEVDRWQRWAGIDPDDEEGPDPNEGANDRIFYSLDVQRKIREALLSEAAMGAAIDAEAGVLGLNEASRIEWEPIVRKTCTAAVTAALDAAGIGGQGDDDAR